MEPVQRFNKPVVMRLSYEGVPSGLDERFLRIYWYDFQENIYRMVNTSEPDPGGRLVRAEAGRFSVFRIGQHVPQDKIISKDTVYVYPNPVPGDRAVFKFLPEKAADVSVEIFNVAGQPVGKLSMSCSDEDAGKWQEIELDTSRISSGVYIFRIRASGEGRADEVIKRMAVIK